MVELQDWIRDRIQAAPEPIAEYCDRWKITEFTLFGSVLWMIFDRAAISMF